MVITNGHIVDSNLNRIGSTLFKIYPPTTSLIRNFYRNCFVGCTMAMDRTKLMRILPSLEEVPMHDWYIGLKFITLRSKIVFVHEPYMLYRRHGSNNSETGSKSKYSIIKKLLMRFTLIKVIF
jgi:hypothetical protein